MQVDVSAELIVSVFAFVISVSTALLAFVKYEFDKSRQSENLRLAWTKQVIDWSDDCIVVMSKMRAHLKSQESIKRSEKQDNVAALAALMTSGRLRFENQKEEKAFKGFKTRFFKIFKKNKTSEEVYTAYQGRPPEFFSALLEAFRAYLFVNAEMDETTSDEARKVIIKNKNDAASVIYHSIKKFTSDIQSIVNPEWFHNRAKRFSDESNLDIKYEEEK
ncbi:MAG: hypothetical protein ACPGVT_06975 [Maricaulaceae bacterium]